jgi:hypothetical protein
VKGKAEPEVVPGSTSASYTITMDEQALSIAAGQIAKALLENALLPAIMPSDCEGANANDPKKCFPGRQDGRITLGELVAGLAYSTNCNNDSFCNSMKGVIDALVSTLATSANFSGSDQTNIKQKLVGKLSDTDEDGQFDDLVADITTTPSAGGSSTPMMSHVTVYGRYEGRECTGDTGVDDGKSKFCNTPTTGPQDPYAANLQLACRFAQNPIDGCFTSNFCGVPEGTRRGGESCIGDNECYSGTCMKRPVGVTIGYTDAQVDKCYKACKNDVDCAGEGSCLADGYVFTRADGPQADVTVTGTCVRTTP